MVVQITTDHLLCQGHYQALAMQTEAVPALGRLTGYIGVQQTYSAKGQRTNVVSFGGHPASVTPTQLPCGDRKAGKWLCPSTHAGLGLQDVGCHLLVSLNLASQTMDFGQAALASSGHLLPQTC